MPADALLSFLPPGLSPDIVLLLLICSVFTSMVTAALGAGGGVMLLALMAMWVPPAAVIPVHGIIQLGSNAGRMTMTWRHVDWRVIAAFAPGVVLGALAGSLVLVSLPPWAWQVTIALFVLYLCWGPNLPNMALGKGGILVASALTSFISLFVGATGPLVAAFIKQIHRERFTTVATFATAMTLQHLPKALVFGLAGFVFREWVGFLAAMIACGFVGTWLGLRLLGRMGNRWFRNLFNILLTLLAARLLWLAWLQWTG